MVMEAPEEETTPGPNSKSGAEDCDWLEDVLTAEDSEGDLGIDVTIL